jgi:hypothetical protein
VGEGQLALHFYPGRRAEALALGLLSFALAGLKTALRGAFAFVPGERYGDTRGSVLRDDRRL